MWSILDQFGVLHAMLNAMLHHEGSSLPHPPSTYVTYEPLTTLVSP